MQSLNRTYPFYDLVPKDRDKNLEFRKSLIEYGESGKDAQEEIWDMCRRDILFYVNAFCFLIEPRDAVVLPWITYEQQDEAFDTLLHWWGKRDIIIFKARDQGGTWILCTTSYWQYEFGERESSLLLSRKEEMVDSPGDWDALFQKIDFIRDNTPSWLVCEEHRVSLHRENLERPNIIDGESTNKAATTGKRRRVVGFDELARMDRQADHWASAGAVTDCRIGCFTPWYDAHYARQLTENPNIIQINLDWDRDPRKNPGLYRSIDGVLEIIDKSYPFPENYPFILDGELRSVWWDWYEANRAQSKSEMDLLYRKRWVGGELAWFDHDALRQYEREWMNEPWITLELSYNAENPVNTAKPIRTAQGRWQLWLNLMGDLNPPADEYVVGADVATGTTDMKGRGASNSSLSVFRKRTCEQVAEFTVGGMDPKEFARCALATCGFFRDWSGQPARLKWEKGGAGSVFGNEVIRLNYRNIYWKESRTGSIAPDVTDEPGWAPSLEGRRDLFSEFAIAVRRRQPTLRSRMLILEMKDYIFGRDGHPEHMSTIKTTDPTNVRANHGDRVVGAMMSWSECDRNAQALMGGKVVKDSPWTLAGRRLRRQRRRQEADGVKW